MYIVYIYIYLCIISTVSYKHYIPLKLYQIFRFSSDAAFYPSMILPGILELFFCSRGWSLQLQQGNAEIKGDSMLGTKNSWCFFSPPARYQIYQIKWYTDTPSKIHMEPENDGFNRNLLFQYFIFRFHINFRGCTAFTLPLKTSMKLIGFFEMVTYQPAPQPLEKPAGFFREGFYH